MPTNIVSPTSKGQVTIPAKIRQRLEIDSNSLLVFELKGEKIIITPARVETADSGRVYSQREIDEFLKLDKISPENREFADKLLKKWHKRK